MDRERAIEVLETAREFFGSETEEAINEALKLFDRDKEVDLIPNEYGGGVCPRCKVISYGRAVPNFCQKCGQRLKARE